MAYPDDLLVSGERVVLHKHPHGKMLVVPVLVLLAGGVGLIHRHRHTRFRAEC